MLDAMTTTEPKGIRRDPFARATLMRYAVTDRATAQTCDWCGAARKTLFVYYWEPDDRAAMRPPADHKFCGVGCFESYYA